MTIHSAKKHVKNGYYACIVSALITFVIILYSMLTNAQDEFAYFNDPWMFFDVILISLCAWGLKKYSRTAAITIFIYFIVSKVIISIEFNQFSGLGMGLLFIYFFFQAIRGTIFYHSYEQINNPSYKHKPKWLLFVGIPCF